MMMVLIEEIKSSIERGIPGSNVLVENPRLDNKHFDITVSSKEFSGKSIVDQHRMVHAAISSLMHNRIHAVKIKTKVERNDWTARKDKIRN